MNKKIENFSSKFLEKINEFNSIVIYTHINSDGDALGSQFGIGNWIESNFKDKKVFYIGDEPSENIKNLFPYKKLKKQINENIIKNSLGIIVDSANKERIFGSSWKKLSYVIKIDHHLNEDEYSNLSFVDPNYSSCSEIVVDLILKLNKKNKDLKFFNKNESKYLLIGIITDTGRFLHNSTNSMTLFFAHKLLEQGVELESIYNVLYNKNLNLLKFSSFVVMNHKRKNNVSYFIAPKKIEKKYNLKYQEISSQVNLLMQTSDIKYALYLTWNSDEKIWKGSLRSKGKPINVIASKFNGGGHKNASGFKLEKRSDYKKVLELLLNLN